MVYGERAASTARSITQACIVVNTSLYLDDYVSYCALEVAVYVSACVWW
jgi:hypothetical protein